MWSPGWRRWVLSAAFSIVPGGLLAASPARGVPGPEPISPGRPDRPGVSAERCPTFSWSAAPGASGYEIALYPESVAAPEHAAPLVRVEVPAPASSWTPSLDQCLEPGARYVWFVRERGSPEQPDGEWSAGSTFEVDKSAAPVSEADLAALVKDLKHVEIQLDRIAQSGAVSPQGLAEGIQNPIDQLTAWVGPVYTRVVDMYPKVVTDPDAIHPTVLDIQKTLNVVGVKTDEARLATNTIQKILSKGQELPELRRLLDHAFEGVVFSAATELQGMDDFLGPGEPCAQGSECFGFRNQLLATIDDLVESMTAYLELAQATGASPPRLHDGLLRSAFETVPGTALYPLYKLLVVNTNSLESLKLRDLAEHLRAVRPLFAEEASGSSVADLRRVQSAAPNADQPSPCELVNSLTENGVSKGLLVAGLALRGFGTLLQAAGETRVDGTVGAGAGAVIRNNWLKKLGLIINGLGGGSLLGSGTITQRQRHCELLDGQAKLPQSQDIQSLVTGVTALSNDLGAGGKLDVAAIAAAVNSVGGNVDGIASHLTAVDSDVDAVAAALRTHDGALGSHDARLGAVDARVGAMAAALHTHDGALASHDAKLAAVGTALGTAVSAHDLRLAEHHQAFSTSAAALDGKLAAVDQKLEALGARVDGIQASAKVLHDRSIEQQLASCQGLVSLFLPAAFGGSLESVVEVARSSISRSKDAGLDTKNAERFLEKAEREIVARRFSKAFDLLCKAYPARTDGDS